MCPSCYYIVCFSTAGMGKEQCVIAIEDICLDSCVCVCLKRQKHCEMGGL